MHPECVSYRVIYSGYVSILIRKFMVPIMFDFNYTDSMIVQKSIGLLLKCLLVQNTTINCKAKASSFRLGVVIDT